MAEAARDPWLLVHGPLTAALRMTARVRPRLAGIAGGADVVAVPLQGSGAFAGESAPTQRTA